MTYCVGIEVNDGLIFAADTRTSGSFDDVRVHRKMHVFEYPGERVLVLMSAGNLATTQLTMSRLQSDVDESAVRSLRSVAHLVDAAEYIGESKKRAIRANCAAFAPTRRERSSSGRPSAHCPCAIVGHAHRPPPCDGARRTYEQAAVRLSPAIRAAARRADPRASRAAPAAGNRERRRAAMQRKRRAA